MSRTRGTVIIQAIGDELRLCLARGGRASVELSHQVVIRAAKQGDDVSVLNDEAAVRSLLDSVRQRRWAGLDAVCLLGGSQVSSQYYELPPLTGAALRQAVDLKLSQQLHFPVAEAIVAVNRLATAPDPTTGQIRVGATAIHHDLARDAVKVTRDAELNLVAMTTAPAAMTAHARELVGGESGFSGVLYVDEHISVLIVLRGGVPVVTTDIAFGAADLTAAMMRPIISGDEVIQLDLTQATTLRNSIGIPTAQQTVESIQVTGERLLPLLEPVLQKLTKQLTQWLTYAGAKASPESHSLRLVGPGSTIPGLAETLAERLAVRTLRADWLEGLVNAGPGLEPAQLPALSAVVGAVRHRSTLPDLLPPDTRRRLRLKRLRRSVTLCGPVVAAAIGFFGLLFARVGFQVRPALADHERRLTELQSLLTVAARNDAARLRSDELERQLTQFDRSSPLWVGVFKEMSNLLPVELQATQFNARVVDGQSKLVLTGDVFRTEHSPGFDKIVEQTLILLDHSPFCAHVRLISANRQDGAKSGGLAGTLSVEVALAHPKDGARRPQP